MSSDLRTRNIFFLNRIFGFVSVFLCVAGATAKEPVPRNPQTLAVSVPHLYYTCPEGATAKLMCAQRGAVLHADDKLSHNWLYTPHAQQHCHAFVGPRHTAPGHANHQLGVSLDEGERDFSLTLRNVTARDQGRYCCVAVETTRQRHKAVQRHHGHILMLVTPRTNISQECTMWDPQPTESSVAAALATTACIVALLSLPLIMLLVYKQRQHHRSSRRAHELVRMDSEAQGHENPVFLGGSPQPKTRTVSQIMTRQSSETGRHLLSEPGTPLTPPVHGDVFFPIHDAILESPEFSGPLASWTP